MTTTVIIGNIISFIAALFMVASCLARSKRKIFFYQGLECFILAGSSAVLGSSAGTVTLLLCAVRNVFIAKNVFSKPIMWSFVLLTVIIGGWVNALGLLGLIPIIATVQYTFCSHYITSVKGTKYSIFVNVLMWVVYSFMIFDFSTAISDVIILVIDSVDIFRIHREERRAAAANI